VSARRLVAIGTGTTLAAAMLVTTGVSSADAATITACVKKSSGQVKVLKSAKKKCKKGWKKKQWFTPSGVPHLVGHNGTDLGILVGSFPFPYLLQMALSPNGIYTYLPNGSVFPNTDSVRFLDSSCTGPASMQAQNAQALDYILGMAGGQVRFVERRTTPTFGPTRAWQATKSVFTVNLQQIYRFESDGTCIASSIYTGTLVKLTAVTPAADVTGPLRTVEK